ncbi:MAG: threonylcarbamoyl-AMP synthase [Chlamydiia bacterium]|nr:threonylcarbamoyl-AMP synthase [Chlamydiia bacterium]
MNSELEEALLRLHAGRLVALPTETVYGLGADASSPEAINKIFAAKNRPTDHPLIVHIGSAQDIESWAIEVPAEAHLLAAEFWPGPLTLILKKAPHVPSCVTGGQDSIGLRVPAHPLALELLQRFGGGVAAPSANRFGRISPTTAAHVQVEMAEVDCLVLDGGPCLVGVESTIVDLSHGKARVLRPGGVSLADLERVIGYVPEHVAKPEIRASGCLDKHYAPTTPARLLPRDAISQAADSHSAVLARSPKPDDFPGLWLQAPESSEAYAQQLYAALRTLDEAGYKQILIESVPDSMEWLAVRDRLRRSTAP